MTNNDEGLLKVLRREHEFLSSGGYRKPTWRPQFIFEDSPTCLKHDDAAHARACSECPLMPLVPAECRGNKVPCRQIPLNAQGDTVDYFYRCGTLDELEVALHAWLTEEIRELELKLAAAEISNLRVVAEKKALVKTA